MITVMLASVTVAQAAVPEPQDFRMDDYRAPVPDTVQGATVLHVRDIQSLLPQGRVVLIDVLPAPRRPPEMRPGTPWLPVPHHDLPGSLWWPDIGRGALPPDLESRFEARARALSAANPGVQLVFYCLDQCWMSWNAAKRAATYNLPVAWFPEGADGWTTAGLPTQVATPDFLD